MSQATEKTIRLIRPSVVVLCGPAACGKSTFAERHFRATQIISSDWARGRVCDDERDQRFQAQAFALVHFLIEQRLSLNRLCVVDSTALTLQARKDLLDLAKKYQVPCTALLFEISLEKCVERDQARERAVGRSVIERQYQLYEQAKAAIREEGFEQVIELRDEDLDKVRIEVIFRPVARPAAATPRPAGQGAFRGQGRPGGARAGGPPASGGPRTPALGRAEAQNRGTAAQAGSAGMPAQLRARLVTPGSGPAPTPMPVAAPKPASAAAPKPDAPGPAAASTSPPVSQDPAKPTVSPAPPSGTPPEPGKT